MLLAGAVLALGVLGGATVAEAAPHARTASVSEYRLGELVVAGRGDATTSTVGNAGALVLLGSYDVRWTGTRAPARLALERRIGAGRWTRTTAKVSSTSAGLSVRTPRWSTKAKQRSVAYRLVSTAYTSGSRRVANTSRSHAVRIGYENQARYTGLAKRIWGYAKPYCPNTAVHVAKLGSAAGDYRTGTLLIRVTADVATYSAKNLRALALHECSHERQWLNYGGTAAGHRTMTKAAKRYFSTWSKPAGAAQPPYRLDPPDPAITPIEHAADCGAQALNPGGYLGYGGYCTAKQLAEGKRLLRGHRY
ncbi:porin family protein [Amnibacterium setariae]|uniref:DUF4157 domain-containing protein n=1 Tax=Amnibacterium setariae TaxID=2306585 RepID=A0A3A1TVP8_9MICO|nr:hypothetical protein [Amnibacterium setariae]RIX27879.1 hypothetical protein D1781_10125 [Amnibacterium setariae]